jgi:hypothetical protein
MVYQGGASPGDSAGVTKMGEKSNYFKRAKIDFLPSPSFELSIKVTEDSVNDCDFVKFIISVRSGPGRQKAWLPHCMGVPSI